MHGPRGRGGAMPPMKSMKGQMPIFKRLMGIIMKHYAVGFIVMIACIVITALCTLQGTLFMQTLIDSYITPMINGAIPAEEGFASLQVALGRLALILLAGIACSYIKSVLTMVIGQGALLEMRKELFARMETLPISYFDTHSHGDIMSVYTNDIDTLRQLISQSIPNLVDAAITVITTFVSMIVLSWQLTILSLLMIGVTAVVSAKLAGKAGKNFVLQQENLGRVNGYIEEMMTGQKVVKVFCHEEKALDQFYTINDELRTAATNANAFANVMGPVNNNLGHISYVLCAMVGAAIAISGQNAIADGRLAADAAVLTLGSLVTFLTLNRNFSRPISTVSQQMNSIVMAMAGAKRVFDMMDSLPETDDGDVLLVNAKATADGTLTETEERTHIWAWKHRHGDGTTTYTRLQGGVVFEHVDFGYVPEKTVLHDINMYAMPGQKIAFVGGTGAGKTTITNLINRFYDIQNGKIRYDGENIGRIKKDDLRRSLGIVLQDTHLFTGTVMENIRYGCLEATDDECIRAAVLANADGFIRRLPNGYDTMLTGDGANLSQGQRQLIAIARAAVADPPCLILDEATSSIDTRTEALVQRGMDALMKNRTTFVIAHRLSTVRNSDCIMVLEQGRIIERGTHDELIAQKGKYYQLYTGNSIRE